MTCSAVASGLIDAGETAAQAAVREMKEETGLTVKATTVSPGRYSLVRLFVTCVSSLGKLHLQI